MPKARGEVTPYWRDLFLAPHITASWSSSSSKPTPFLQAMGSLWLVQFGLRQLKMMQLNFSKDFLRYNRDASQQEPIPWGANCSLLMVTTALHTEHAGINSCLKFWCCWQLYYPFVVQSSLPSLETHTDCALLEHWIFSTNISRQGNCSGLARKPFCPFVK